MNNSIVKTIAIAGILIGLSAHKAQANTNLDFECMKYYESQKITLDGKFNRDKKVYEYYYKDAISNDVIVSIVGKENFIMHTYQKPFSSRIVSQQDNDRFTYHKSSIEINKYSQSKMEELCQRPAEVSQPEETPEPEPQPEPQVKTQELPEIVRQVISEELKKALPPLQPQVKTEELREIIRQLIAEELKKSLPQSQPQTQPESQTEIKTQPSNP